MVFALLSITQLAAFTRAPELVSIFFWEGDPLYEIFAPELASASNLPEVLIWILDPEEASATTSPHSNSYPLNLPLEEASISRAFALPEMVMVALELISTTSLSAFTSIIHFELLEAFISKDHGLEGDAHAGKWHRQVSFLASESIEEAKKRGLDVTFGDFAENIATEGIDWKTLPIGTRVRLGQEVLVEITQIGKECHNKCAIYYKAGDCIMPREGVFARVLEEGKIRTGDEINIISNRQK